MSCETAASVSACACACVSAVACTSPERTRARSPPTHAAAQTMRGSSACRRSRRSRCHRRPPSLESPSLQHATCVHDVVAATKSLRPCSAHRRTIENLCALWPTRVAHTCSRPRRRREDVCYSYFDSEQRGAGAVAANPTDAAAVRRRLQRTVSHCAMQCSPRTVGIPRRMVRSEQRQSEAALPAQYRALHGIEYRRTAWYPATACKAETAQAT